MSDFRTDWKPTSQHHEESDIRKIIQIAESKAPFMSVLGVIRKGAALAKKRNTLAGNFRLQGVAIKYLSLIWQYLPEEEQAAEALFWSKSLKRCIDAHSEDQAKNIFLDLLTLDGDAEIRRALSVDAASFTLFDPDPGDELYLEAKGWLSGYLMWCRNTAVPLPFHFWSGITILGAMCKRRLWHRRGPEDFYMNWYTVLAGDRGSGKSVARGLAMDIVDRCNRAIEMESGNSQHPALLFTFGGDTTSQGFTKALSKRFAVSHDDDYGTKAEQDCCSLLDVDELATFLGRDTYTPVARLAAITELKNKKRYHKTLESKSFVLRNVVTSILACCAPNWMRGAIDPNIQQGGVLDRTLFVYRNSTVREFPTAPAIDPILAQELAYSLKDSVKYRMVGMGEPFVDTPAADKWYNHWYNQQARFYQRGKEDGYSLHRKGENLTRLASLLALSADTLHVSNEHYELAAAIFSREIEEQLAFRRIINESPIDTDLRNIAAFIKAQGGCVNRSSITIRFRSLVGLASSIQERMDAGVSRGLWIEVPGPKTGSLFRLPRHKCKKCREGEEKGRVILMKR